ncbi:NUDIX hydrolase [Rhizobium rhizogenes]|uniref:NUDIX hydrolase n=1 Tax=Rhizobium rhizogenes TaxID=359 RepID=UPI0015733D20|nr:NUDIX hydrolase [Rhizobium rhizogenes]NTI32883.1 NUDIX hydrolase [Rhizobium rhizogenes]
MTTNEPHPARLSAHADTMLRGELAEQFGAICMRRRADDEMEVLLITTRRTQGWIIPKGWPIKGLKPHEVAEREAWEEAGVKGSVRESPFGYHTYLKVLDSENTMPSMVQVHLLDVKKMHDRFPEAKQRTTEWLSPSEAALRVREPELKGLIFLDWWTIRPSDIACMRSPTDERGPGVRFPRLQRPLASAAVNPS